MQIQKANKTHSYFLPLEWVSVSSAKAGAKKIVARDGKGRVYAEQSVRPGQAARFRVRGAAGEQSITVEGDSGKVLEQMHIRLAPKTDIRCDKGPYAELMMKVQQMIEKNADWRPWVINGRSYRVLVCWSRDHVYTLKAAKYFIDDVQSGLDYYLDQQLPNGMLWDNIETNNAAPAHTWLADAIGKGWFAYDDENKIAIRRVPVLADTEYVWAEGVWSAWKASGDDAWMAKQLPRLEKALKYMTTDPIRWSKKHGLMRRSFTMDEWDFANQHYCAGDHRCIYPQDPRFLFHGNQSGLYATYWRMAEMYEHLGNAERGAELREEGEKFRKRANDKLFFKTNYGHMIPETLSEKKVYALVGDERKRMSLSTGYTINRKLPTHEMAVKILREYQKRGKANRGNSFAEWWSMDPMYSPAQWPGTNSWTAGCPEGEYMNGGVTPLVAGEISKAAFDHGMESYGTDILDRLWKLALRDGGWLNQLYKRIPENASLPKTKFQTVDLRSVVNRGLKNKAYPNVEAWLGEGANDLRNLPVGRRKFGAIEFDVIKPAGNGGRVVLRLDADPAKAPSVVTIPVENLKGRSVYFLHCTGRGSGGIAAATYDVQYSDGTTERIWIRPGREIGLWWGTSENAVDRKIARRAWWGANGSANNVGMYMFGWTNPHPDKTITAIRVEVLKESKTTVLLAGISLSDQPVAFEVNIRSHGLPDCWAQGAVYYAIAEGLAGIEDEGAAFSEVKVSPRWSSTPASRAEVTLHYPASDGYCSYQYNLDKKARKITLELTGSFSKARVHCLLPAGRAKQVIVDGKKIGFKNATVEKSSYVDFTLTGLPKQAVIIKF